jgi:Sec-independent protein translocase protein TatA
MTHFILVLFAVIILLAVSLRIAVKVAGQRGKKNHELKNSLESAQNELRRLGEYQSKKEEAQQNADAKKETLHTGDSGADFDNSLNLLHNAASAPR